MRKDNYYKFIKNIDINLIPLDYKICDFVRELCREKLIAYKDYDMYVRLFHHTNYLTDLYILNILDKSDEEDFKNLRSFFYERKNTKKSI